MFSLTVYCDGDILIYLFVPFLASVVRHIYMRPGVGVGGLRKVYGGELVDIR